MLNKELVFSCFRVIDACMSDGYRRVSSVKIINSNEGWVGRCYPSGELVQFNDIVIEDLLRDYPTCEGAIVENVFRWDAYTASICGKVGVAGDELIVSAEDWLKDGDMNPVGDVVYTGMIHDRNINRFSEITDSFRKDGYFKVELDARGNRYEVKAYEENGGVFTGSLIDRAVVSELVDMAVGCAKCKGVDRIFVLSEKPVGEYMKVRFGCNSVTVVLF